MKNKIRSIGAALLMAAAMACMFGAIQPQTAKAQEGGGTQTAYLADHYYDHSNGDRYIGSVGYTVTGPSDYVYNLNTDNDLYYPDPTSAIQSIYWRSQDSNRPNTQWVAVSGNYGGCYVGWMSVPCYLFN